MTTPKTTTTGKGAKAGGDAANSSTTHDVDRVAMASRTADGTPDQTPGFEYVDPEVAVEATAAQLTEQRASALDEQHRAPAGEDPLDNKQVEQLADAQDKAAESARKDAEAEVNAHS